MPRVTVPDEELVEAVCTDCGETFEREQGKRWQRKCWPCWRVSQEPTDRQAEYDRGYAAGFKAGSRPCPLAHHPPAPACRHRQLDWSPEFLLRLIQLTHPDHQPAERAQLANEITAQLTVELDRRGRQT